MIRLITVSLFCILPLVAMEQTIQEQKILVKLGSAVPNDIVKKAISPPKDELKSGTIALLQQYPGHVRKMAQIRSSAFINEWVNLISIDPTADAQLPFMYVSIKSVRAHNHGIIIYDIAYAKGKTSSGQKFELNHWVNHDELKIISQDNIQVIEE